VGVAVLEKAAGLVSACSRQLAAKRHHHADDGNAVHRVRFHRRLVAGIGAEITGFSSNRPNLVGDPNSGPQTAEQWFNLAAFQQLDPVANAGQFGTAGRNIVEGPGYANWDISAFKNIPLTEQANLQFRAEFFNAFNRPNFRLPDSDISSPNFGRIQSAQAPRLIQFALKFLY
jgi:hypothetical protein